MTTSSVPFYRILLATLAVLAGVAPASAQRGRTARLSVVVVDSAALPVPGAGVKVSGVSAATLSDSAGLATVERIPTGARMVLVERTGYAPENLVIQLDPGADLRIQVTLMPVPFTLDTVQVVARRQQAALSRVGFYTRQKQGLGSFITREELEASSFDLALVLERLRGFTVVWREGGRLAVVSTRGLGGLSSAGCVPRVYVDGVPSNMESLGALMPREVEAIEGYAGSASAPGEYATNSSCGVILVWMRK